MLLNFIIKTKEFANYTQCESFKKRKKKELTSEESMQHVYLFFARRKTDCIVLVYLKLLRFG